MKVKKESYKVSISTKEGSSYTADDATFAGAGTGAYQALLQKRDCMFKTADGMAFVPFGAVDHAIITVTSSEEEVTDSNCE